MGRLKSCTITHAIFPPDNRFFCVFLIQTYKALCCFQKSLCCRNNSQTCQTHIGFPPPSPVPSPDPEAGRQPSGLPGTCAFLPTRPKWKLTLHFSLLLTKYGSKFEFEVNLREHLATPASSAWPWG